MVSLQRKLSMTFLVDLTTKKLKNNKFTILKIGKYYARITKVKYLNVMKRRVGLRTFKESFGS